VSRPGPCYEAPDSSGKRDTGAVLEHDFGALEFHQVDPDGKGMALSGAGVTLGLDVLLAESRKYVLLCSNCHAEVEGGVALLPARVAKAASDGSNTP
jgi:hypothetical protein